jgi:hypothetical protein
MSNDVSLDFHDYLPVHSRPGFKGVP